MRILLVEDEPRLAATVSKGLQAEGFVVVRASNGGDGLWHATEEQFDAIVLDIMLPGLSGYEVLRRLRAREVWTPVLMLTAKDGEYDETDAFDLGADDYLTKPFRFRVLVARIRALVRRGAPQRPAVLTAGTLTLDPARRVVERDGTPIALTPREFGVLEHLMMKKDTVVTKAEIVASVWDRHFDDPTTSSRSTCATCGAKSTYRSTPTRSRPSEVSATGSFRSQSDDANPRRF